MVILFQDDCTMLGLTTSQAWWHIIIGWPTFLFV